MAVGVSSNNYNLFHENAFGGVSAISVRQFNFINGFSNQFWGWGGEDDDMDRRVRGNNLEVMRYSEDIAR